MQRVLMYLMKIVVKYLRNKVKISKKIKSKYSKKISSLKLKNFSFNFKDKTIFKDQNFFKSW